MKTMQNPFSKNQAISAWVGQKDYTCKKERKRQIKNRILLAALSKHHTFENLHILNM